jgi:BirA family biotin operon repressor/biotin-[acetyl-CoA-carboxylase] ligase
MARNGAGEGTWVRADRQLAGRGRQGRIWDSPPGNLYTSTLVQLRADDPPAASLALVAAVALDETVGGYVDPGRLRLKWPNDLLLGGAKVSGILLERADDAVVIGIGVNLAHHPELADRPTTSLAEHGAAVTPAAFLERLADMLGAWLVLWRRDGLSPVIRRWSERAHPVGTRLSANLPDGEVVSGTFLRLDEHGALVLGLADGAERVIHAGDVFAV